MVFQHILFLEVEVKNMKLSDMPQNNFQKQNQTKAKSINEAYDELKNCSSDELMQRLAGEIQSQKNSGTFDYEGLKASIEKMKI